MPGLLSSLPRSTERVFPKVYFLVHCSNLNASRCGFPLWGLVRQRHALFLCQHILPVGIPPSWEPRHRCSPHSDLQVGLPPGLPRGDKIKGGWKPSPASERCLCERALRGCVSSLSILKLLLLLFFPAYAILSSICQLFHVA